VDTEGVICCLKIDNGRTVWDRAMLIKPPNKKVSYLSICKDCKGYISLKALIKFNKFRYCSPCLNRLTVPCEDCRKRVYETSSYKVEDYKLCEDCFHESYFICDHCSEQFSKDDEIERNTCGDCVNKRRMFFKFKKKVLTPSQLNKNKAFGIELECIKRKNDKFNETVNYFSSVNDGSIGDDGGREFVSVPLPNNGRGFKIVSDFVKSIKPTHKVDTDCGYHLHINMLPYVNAKTDSINKITTIMRKVLIGYLHAEPLLLKMVSRSRKSNHFCQKLNNIYDIDSLMNKKNYEFLSYFYSRPIVKKRQINTDKWHKKRYEWVNLHSLFVKNTTEIRLHQGTLDAKKILYWYHINQKLIDYFATHQIKTVNKFNTDRFYSLLRDKEQIYIKSRVNFFLDKRMIIPMTINGKRIHLSFTPEEIKERIHYFEYVKKEEKEVKKEDTTIAFDSLMNRIREGRNV